VNNLRFLIVKKFLYKPIKKTLKDREEKLEEKYTEADERLENAKNTEAELNEKLSEADKAAEQIVSDATVVAERRKAEITAEAQAEADNIVRLAHAEAELERKKAQGDIKTQIVDVSLALSEKLIEREIKEEDHHNLIDSFISQIGDEENE
jgi:F-type H+-transporting ATPase subunit b